MDQVYWIRNAECTDINSQGYVGVSQNPQRRLREHLKKNSRIPNDVWIEIIFEGTREDCFLKEEELRPIKNVGWNRAVGGAQGFKKGFVHSDITREKLRVAWTAERKKIASIEKARRNKLLKGQKRPRQSDAMFGAGNPMFGRTHSADAIKKIVEANRGKIAINRQELYCIGCHDRASQHVLTRHEKCWKKYRENNND